MATPHRLVFAALALLVLGHAIAQPAPEKPRPDARFGNWLFKTPDPKVWTRTEKNGALVFAAAEPPGDFCTITLFAGDHAGADFPAQFERAVAADLKAKDTVKIEADSGAKPGKSAEGFDTLTRSLRTETSTMHNLHLYVGGHSGDRFDLAAFQSSSEDSWKQHGAQASQFLLSLKLANSLPAGEVAKLLGTAPTEAPPTLPGFDDAPAATATPAAATPVEPANASVPNQPEPVIALAPANVPDRPLNQSPLVVNNAVTQRNGRPVDGVKLSQHDMDIGSPSIAVSAHGVIHVAFVEQHRTTYAYAVYHRSSSDGGKTWGEAKNLSEDMPGLKVGRCYLLIDGRDRVYVIWRTALAPNFPANIDPNAVGSCNLVYRVLEEGHWSRIQPINSPASAQTQNAGSLSYYAAVDAAGRVQAAWNAMPDFWHPELTRISGTFHQHMPGICPGLVFQATLDGANPAAPHEVFLTPILGVVNAQNPYGYYNVGLDTLNGYFDAAGAAHFLAAISWTHDESLRHVSRYQLIENRQMGPVIDLPELSYHAWRDFPTLLVDAQGRRHAIAYYPAGEHPNVRDYLVGSDEEPVIIRKAASVKGSVAGFQACQGPGGRMVAIMEMSDTGERGEGETYVSISNGGAWSTPVNVTNNAGRRTFASRQTSVASNVAVAKSYYPGAASAAFDREGHLLLLMINNEYGLFSSNAFGVELAGGSSGTPTLQFLRF
ncbi:MAG TPA: hypothetical protein VHD32_16635 [Candidatus Didemnitutus sp.]|nr:hypothetical protein [Candidatus Didemnitutus sp.]